MKIHVRRWYERNVPCHWRLTFHKIEKEFRDNRVWILPIFPLAWLTTSCSENKTSFQCLFKSSNKGHTKRKLQASTTKCEALHLSNVLFMFIMKAIDQISKLQFFFCIWSANQTRVLNKAWSPVRRSRFLKAAFDELWSENYTQSHSCAQYSIKSARPVIVNSSNARDLRKLAIMLVYTRASTGKTNY